MADALSRAQAEPCLAISAISAPTSDLYDQVRDSWLLDSSLQHIIKEIEADPLNHSKYSWQNDVLKRKGKLVVGENVNLRRDLLTFFHGDSIGGHSGMLPTFRRLSAIFYWRGMEKDVWNFIRECSVCQRFKPELVASPGLIQLLPIPDTIWTDLSMDFICGLPRSYTKNFILVVVDRLAAHFMSLKHLYSAIDVARIFLDGVVKLHGFPKSIVSDRDSAFCGKFWKELCKLYGIKLKFSSAYHP